MTTKKDLRPDERRAISLVKMEMVKMAKVDIKNIFPALKNKFKKIAGTTKRPSNTRKGSGRYRPNQEEIKSRLAKQGKQL